MEVLAVILTLLSAYFTIKANKICWPLGIASTIIYIYLMLGQHLYGQVLANMIIVLQCVYGWYYWNTTQNEQCDVLRHDVWITHLLIICLISFITIPLLKKYTDNPQVELDVLSTLLALLANFYLARKFINGFMTWILADILLIIMFFNQSMYWSAGLYIILIGFSINGLFKWTKNLKMG